MTTPTTTDVERYEQSFTELEQATLIGFLAGYRGFTRDAYALDLRQFTAWCWQHDRRLFDVRRVDIESFARDLEDRGRARATVARRLSTVGGFYRYAEEEGVIDHSPAVHIRRPRIDYDSHVAHLDRNELGAILVTVGISSPRDHATTRSSRYSPSTGCASPKQSAPTSTPSASSEDIAPSPCIEGRQARHDAAGATRRPGDRPGHRRTS